MELVLVVTFAGLIGTAARYILPGRDRHGLAMMPSAGVIFGSLGWLLAIWVGLNAQGPWAWALSLGIAVVGVVVLGIMVPRRRDEADAKQWAELTTAA
jgi:uncharacterized membrane protein YeaQ/YmgE (transglycosylase-associated protein family)